MKAIPVRFKNGEAFQVEPDKATYIRIHLPGPSGVMFIPVIIKGTREGTGKWSWNGDTEKPTLMPSVLTQSGHFEPSQTSSPCWCNHYKEHPDKTPVFQCFRCHTWINAGRAQFLSDSTHEFAGQTLDLLDVT